MSVRGEARILGPKKDIISGRWAIAAAVGLTSVQIVLGLFLAWAGPSRPESLYERFNQWDSIHYLDIAKNGYHIPETPPTSRDVHEDRANAGFFPSFPLVARYVSRILGVSAEIALPLTAQAAAVVFWFYFFLCLGRLGIARLQALAVAGTIASHPAAFFLVSGYSESLFLAALLGMMYWTDQGSSESPRKGAQFLIIAGAHGFVLSATRLFGLPLAFYPLIRWFGLREAGRETSPVFPAVASILGVLGGLAFFGWCQLRFGQWDLYLKLQRLGWGNDPYWIALIDPRSYIPRFFFEDTMDSISRASIPFTAWLFGWVLWREYQRKPIGIWERLGLYFSAFLLFYLPLAAKFNAKMDSMIRYTFLPFVLLAMRSAGLVPEWTEMVKKKKLLWVGLALAVATQLWMAYRFFKGGWVA